MTLIKWDDETLSVGIRHIDKQHKTLVNYINELATLIDNQADHTQLDEIYSQLVQYTQYHFASEEHYFETLSNNDLALHKLQHKHFLEELDNFKKEPVSIDLLHFLLDWLVVHIQCEDKKFINKHEIKLV
ncbi:bacteriohemerythrin [Thalassotalea sp. G2M2-11]|uniref:bacteriohemerythrin n=1 Tax=Thalassotalea sp. G2M2-11 TaxID=2787627 RepID=UPI0019D3115E|nr:bacteriohemerythrin [Thalassotalea sp. G2M2-11]